MVNKIDLMDDGSFTKLINDSASTADVLRSLGYSIKGNSWAYKIVAERMNKLNITFGQKYQSDSHPIEKIPLKDILHEDSEYNRTKLKERLVQEGIKEYKCECCGLSEWNSKYISLQLHHLNGIHNDNRLSNLQLLCPNCHSQTENFGTKGKGLVIQRKCDSLPVADKELIMKTVSEVGIVEARKKLSYRNSLINAVVKANRDVIIMKTPDGSEYKFPTICAASKYLFEKYAIGKNPESNRSGIFKCCSGKQDSIKGFTFSKRSAEL